MKEFDLLTFNNNIQKDFKVAYKLVSDIESVGWHGNEPEFIDEDEHHFNKERLVDMTKLIKLKLAFALEYLGLNKMLELLDKEYSTYENNLSDLSYISFVDVLYSPSLHCLSQFLNALTSHVEIEENKEFVQSNSLVLLEQILRGTPKLLTDRKIEPQNEAEVRSEVYKVLIHVFPDTVREIPISKISKIYKPDIGVRRLQCAIEYKFVDSEQEAKTAIGGIFEDIQGYEGSKDWTMFYAIIYMTDHFLTTYQIEEEFKLSKVPHNWQPIIVYGKGSRVKKDKIKK
jgi:hypothetical protein